MGAIQSAINSMLGTAGATASVAKGISTQKQNLQLQMKQRAEQALKNEADMKLTQLQIKGQRLQNRIYRAKIKKMKGGKQ